MSQRAIIFDMDGTLLDTLEDIADSMNAALASLGFAPHGLETYRGFVGSGMDILARRALPENARDETTLQTCMAAMRRIYAAHYADKSRPYAGIPELLDTLSKRGIPMAILSNKPHDFTGKMAAELLARWNFQCVRGIIPGQPRKPDPAPALAIAAGLGVEPSKIIFMGDSGIDMQTAVSAGMHPAGVLWGFRGRDELLAAGARTLLTQPSELQNLL